MGPSVAGKVLLPILEPDLPGLQETIEFVLGLESQDPSKLGFETQYELDGF
jgi:hypothetical protein